MNLPADPRAPERSVAWVIALDAFAAAGLAAASATDARSLRDGLAGALSASFADWTIVDLIRPARMARSVACGGRPAALSAAIARIPPQHCPLIVSAMRRCTPVVQPEIADRAELGVLPDGRFAAEVLDARSYAVGPMTTGSRVLGAITIVRGPGRPRVSFGELAMLASAAEIAAVAMARIEAA